MRAKPPHRRVFMQQRRVKQGPRTYPAHAGDPLVYNGADRDAKTTIPD